MTTESADSDAPILVLVISYDGAGFAGSQVQPAARTVQGELDAVVARLAGGPAPSVFAGRTDTGVHAAGQVVSLADPRPDLDTATLTQALNATLPVDIAVVEAARVAAGFSARYDARWREYRYRVWSGPRQPLARSLTWQRRAQLDVGAMDQAARSLIGKRDFAALAGGGEGVPWSARRSRPRGTVRTILRCSCRRIDPWWGEPDGSLIEIRVAADGFLPRMARTIAALLVEVGEGERAPEWVEEVIGGRDRRHDGGTAPASGLILWRVGYGAQEPEADPERSEDTATVGGS